MSAQVCLTPTIFRQRGAVLIVSLIMLLLLTMLAMGSMRGTTLEEKMAGNMRDQNLAFQAAEAALREAEDWLAGINVRPAESSICKEANKDPFVPCQLYAATVFAGIDMSKQSEAWWNSNAVQLGGAWYSDPQMARPRFLREEIGFIPDNLDVNRSSRGTPGRMVYRITARGTGQTTSAAVVLQTTYAKRFN